MESSLSGQKYIGIREIAKLAGVSTATVSRVLNHPEVTSPEVRARVQRIIEEQRYVPNQTVKNLFSRTSNSIALFIYDMSNPFYISLIQELNQVAFAKRYTLLICDTSNDVTKEREYLDYCMSIRAAGIILTEGFDFIANENRGKLPLVMFDRSGMNRYPTVYSDNAESVEQVVYYLYNLNHRKIAFVGRTTELLSIQERANGYRNALKKKGIPYRQEYVFERFPQLDMSVGVEAMNYFFTLPDPPTAVVCANDLVAKGVILRAQALNMNVPRDLSVVGFDGIDTEYSTLKLTTVRQNISVIAHKLLELAVSPQNSAEIFTIPTEFIHGETCCYYSEPQDIL